METCFAYNKSDDIGKDNNDDDGHKKNISWKSKKERRVFEVQQSPFVVNGLENAASFLHLVTQTHNWLNDWMNGWTCKVEI